MSKVLTGIIVVLSLALLSGCGTKALQKTSMSGEPEWYKTPPVNKDFVYGVYTATSQDMQLATDKASAGARADVGKQIQVQIQSLEKRFNEETGFGKDATLLQMFTDVSKEVMNMSLEGAAIKQKVTHRDGDNWRAYVLIEYPVANTNAALVKECRKNTALVTQMRASEAFKDLEKEVDKAAAATK